MEKYKHTGIERSKRAVVARSALYKHINYMKEQNRRSKNDKI